MSANSSKPPGRPSMSQRERAKRATKRERRTQERKEQAMEQKERQHPLWAEVEFSFFDKEESNLVFKSVVCVPSPPFFQVMSPNGEQDWIPIGIVKRVKLTPSLVARPGAVAAN